MYLQICIMPVLGDNPVHEKYKCLLILKYFSVILFLVATVFRDSLTLLNSHLQMFLISARRKCASHVYKITARNTRAYSTVGF